MQTVSELLEAQRRKVSGDKNKDVWGSILNNVKLFGAKGDGITDDTSEMQSCIDDAVLHGINTVFVPPGSYVVNELQLTGNLTLFCKDVTFISGDKETLILTNFTGQVVGLTIEANSTSSGLNAIRMITCDNVTLSEITINPCGYIGVFLYQCNNVVLDRVNITNWGAVGIYTETCENVLTTNCRIVGGDKTTSHCIQYNRGQYNTIENSYLEKGKHFGVSFVQETRSTVKNNVCFNSSAEAINLEGASYCLVDGNKCNWDAGVSEDFGICLFGPDTSKYANFNVVSNNIISTCGKAGIALADLCLFNNVANNNIYDGNQMMVTNVDGMITLYQQQGTSGPSNNTICGNSGSGDKFNYLVKETAGSGNFFSDNYIQSYKPTSKSSSSTIIKNPQMTWIDYTPSITSVTGTITSLTIDKAEYAFDGEFIRLNVKFHINTNGTGAGQIRIPLPVNAATAAIANSSFTAVETQTSGVALYVNLITSELLIRKYDSSYPVADGSIVQLSGYYNYNH